mmetsp:Transcript_18937/g.42181  ORF Transcript_18937/g.42181 Transcript_18937/m.42181 type:complete len:119 (+) Transcript_18937:414-770(+)
MSHNKITREGCLDFFLTLQDSSVAAYPRFSTDAQGANAASKIVPAWIRLERNAITNAPEFIEELRDRHKISFCVPEGDRSCSAGVCKLSKLVSQNGMSKEQLLEHGKLFHLAWFGNQS